VQQVECRAKNSTAADDVEKLNAEIKEIELQRDLAKQCADKAKTKVDTLEGSYIALCVSISYG